MLHNACHFTLNPTIRITTFVILYVSSSTAAINVTKVIVDISPSDDDVIPVVLNLQDDSIVEPTDFYQLTIVNVSDPNVVVGDMNTSSIIVNDDDGKICTYVCMNKNV